MADPDGLELVWRQFMTQSGVGPSSWTDAYLAAFSQLRSSPLVTFDAAFRPLAVSEANVTYFASFSPFGGPVRLCLGKVAPLPQTALG